ncbi:hypothetical protein THAOC_24278, partial [Thalassiosira oceanica]
MARRRSSLGDSLEAVLRTDGPAARSLRTSLAEYRRASLGASSADGQSADGPAPGLPEADLGRPAVGPG